LAGKVACESGNALTVGEKLSRALVRIGGMARFVRPGARVLIKPNFVGPFRKAATSFDVLEALVGEVRAAGGAPFMAESSGFEFNTEATFRVLGAYELAAKLNVELLNLDDHPYTPVRAARAYVSRFLVSEPVLRADCIINVPRLKGHSLTGLTFGMKNVLGCVARETRRKIHATGLNRGIVELNKIIRSDLCVVDALTYMNRAVFDEERPLGAIVAGGDVVATDIACCRILGIDYRRVSHIELAARESGQNALPEIVGKLPHIEHPGLKTGILTALHRAGIWGIYAADWLYSAASGKTIIPSFHFYAGVRPRINRKRCNGCGECERVCPASAIDTAARKIDAGKCMYVRCLRCVEACPQNAISVLGLRRPRTGRRAAARPGPESAQKTIETEQSFR